MAVESDKDAKYGYRTGYLQLTPGSIAFTGVWLASQDLATNAPGFEFWNNSLLLCGATGSTNLIKHFGSVPFNDGGTYPNGVYLFKGHRLVAGGGGYNAISTVPYVAVIDSLRPNADDNTVTMDSARGIAGVAIPFKAKGAKDAAHNPVSPIEGDEKYVPVMWRVTDLTGVEVSSGDVYGDVNTPNGEFTGNAYVNAAGDFKLHVKFRIYAYLRGKWKMTSSRHISEVTRNFSTYNSGSNITEVHKTHDPKNLNVVQEYQYPTKPGVATTFDKVLAQSNKKYQLVVLHKMGCSHCANSITAINTYDHLFRNRDDLDIIFYGFAAAPGKGEDIYMKEVNEHLWPGQNVNGQLVPRDPSPRNWNGWNNVLYAREPSVNNSNVFFSYVGGIGVYSPDGKNYDTPLIFLVKDGIIRGYATGGIAGGTSTDAIFDTTAKKWYSFINKLRDEDKVFPNDDVSKPVTPPKKPVIDVPAPPPAPEYGSRIEDGNNRTWSPGDGNVTVKVVGIKPFGDDVFQGLIIKADNEYGYAGVAADMYISPFSELDPYSETWYEDAEALEDTVVVLKEEYLNTLSDGEHLFAVAYASGNASFRITKSGSGIVERVQLVTDVSDSWGGSVTEGGNHNINSSVTVTATPHRGYYLSKWIVNGADTAKQNNGNSYSFVIRKNTTVKAVFAKCVEVSANINDTSKGSVTGIGYFEPSSSVTVTISPNSGCVLNYLSVNGSEITEARGRTAEYKYTFKATKDTVISAEFMKSETGGAAPSPSDDCDDCTIPGTGDNTGGTGGSAPDTGGDIGSDTGSQSFVSSGDAQVWSGKGTLSIMLSAPSARFASLKASDGAELVRMRDFMLASGAASSSVITLTEAYLSSLPAGDNIVTAVLDDGRTASFKITVKKDEASAIPSEAPSDQPSAGVPVPPDVSAPPSEMPGDDGTVTTDNGEKLNVDHEISHSHDVILNGSSVVRKGTASSVSFTVKSVVMGADYALMINSRGALTSVRNLRLIIRCGDRVYSLPVTSALRSERNAAESVGSVLITAGSGGSLCVTVPVDYMPVGENLLQLSGTCTNDVTKDIRTKPLPLTVMAAGGSGSPVAPGGSGDAGGGFGGSGSGSGSGGCSTGFGSVALSAAGIVAYLSAKRRESM